MSSAAEGTPAKGKAAKGAPPKDAPAKEKPAKAAAAPRLQPARLKDYYKETMMPALTKQFGYKTVMQVPRITKIVLNMGVGEAVGDKKLLDNAVADMQKVAGQKPVITKSKKSIAVFKIREGYPIGCMVTLRRADASRRARSTAPSSSAPPRAFAAAMALCSSSTATRRCCSTTSWSRSAPASSDR
jgi:hypothetical protein